MVGELFISKRTHFLPLFFNKLTIKKKIDLMKKSLMINNH